MTRPSREPDTESGFPSPTIVDSRRLMGPNFMHAGLGAVLDVALDDTTPARSAELLSAWQRGALQLAHAVGWNESETVQRVYASGASLFLSAPIDQLMTATEVTEAAWVFAEQSVDRGKPDLAGKTAAISAFAQAESNASLRALWAEAIRRDVNCTFDESMVCVGTGAGAHGSPLTAIPPIDAIDWSGVRDIPIVLVTGSNGKTTVVRMIAHMARAAGHTVGYTCTDGVWIDRTQVESGDYSGPAGARRVVQDASVTFAVLETARGGILRRGLAVQRASAAVVVTVAADHLGDYGIEDLAGLAAVKLVVRRAVEASGVLVFNAEIDVLAEALQSYRGRLVPVALDSSRAATIGDDVHGADLTHATPHTATWAELCGVPVTLQGGAQHNMLNAALAIATADALQLADAARASLQTFGADPADNMGRLMRREIGGVTIVVDYAHNAQSITALIRGTSGLPALRRAVTLATGGDRDDHALREIADAAFDTRLIDLYIPKEMPKFLRGRPEGSISGVIVDQLRHRGVPDGQIITAADDLSATRAALEWARDGDLLLLAVHDQRDTILALLDALAASGWRPLSPLPVLSLP
jgi:cyanophycin synthetase